MPFSIAVFAVDDPRMDAARHIREVVFCQEQGVSAEEEWDGEDPDCTHYLLFHDGIPVGTARVRLYEPGVFKVQRVAVLKEKRGLGAGRAIMEEILSRLRAEKPKAVVLSAQCVVEDFYRRLGFESVGDVFEEANIAHIHMVWRP